MPVEMFTSALESVDLSTWNAKVITQGFRYPTGVKDRVYTRARAQTTSYSSGENITNWGVFTVPVYVKTRTNYPLVKAGMEGVSYLWDGAELWQVAYQNIDRRFFRNDSNTFTFTFQVIAAPTSQSVDPSTAAATADFYWGERFWSWGGECVSWSDPSTAPTVASGYIARYRNFTNVNTLSDESSNEYDATATSAATIITAALNGKNVLSFTNDYYQLPAGLRSLTDFSVYAVVRPGTPSGTGDAIIAWDGSGRAAMSLNMDNGGVRRIEAFMDISGTTTTLANSSGTDYTADTDWLVCSMHHTTGSQQLWLQGAMVDSDTLTGAPVCSGDWAQIGLGFAGGTNYAGRIAEIIIYNAHHTAATIEANHTALRDSSNYDF